ncbi:MAG: D-sedoheptulose 7-phosphate isomerase [Deltaproteobacteria bacterium]|nr:D-sedoheptulose 7-phosphate isomerase [Deltaproteobacteria bacterium]
METLVLQVLEQSIRLKRNFIQANVNRIIACAQALSDALENGCKILIFGNGGSAADAQHLAAEFINRFEINRAPLAAMALSTDTSVLTSIGNDFSFNDIFAKQIAALGRAGDVAWGISTSGNSENVIKGLDTARARGLVTFGLAGGDGGKMAGRCDILFAVGKASTARIQETHITVGHILCALVEKRLFEKTGSNNQDL